jgi:hypothetical protein
MYDPTFSQSKKLDYISAKYFSRKLFPSFVKSIRPENFIRGKNVFLFNSIDSTQNNIENKVQGKPFYVITG